MNTWTTNEPREAGFSDVMALDERGATARHILVVDDDRGLRNLLAHFLLGAGYRVSCAEDGKAGWEAFGRDRFDAVITDNNMPRMTGVELLRRVRAASTGIPVILISGLMPYGEADLPDLLSPGLALEKPFSLVEFMTRIRSILPSDADLNQSNEETLRPDFGRVQEMTADHPRDAMVA